MSDSDSNTNNDNNTNSNSGLESKNKKRKCIVICNGPSVANFNIFRSKLLYEKKIGICLDDNDMNDYDYIAVNRWNNIFKKLNINKPPTHVVVGKNSFKDNITNMLRHKNTTFHGFANYRNRNNNYKLLRFGPAECYGRTVNFIGSLWWSGVYAIQLALKLEYDEIHVFGFTCSNGPDAWDRMRRAPIPRKNLIRIQAFFEELKNKQLKDKLIIYENKSNHILRKYL